MLNFNEVQNLKIGDTFYECQRGNNLCMTVTEEPKPMSEVHGNRRIGFKAESDDGLVIDYVYTEKLSSAYGPKLYWQPAYV